VKDLKMNEMFKSTMAPEWADINDEEKTSDERVSRTELHGKYGHVYVYGEDKLGVYTDRLAVKKKLTNLPFTILKQNSDGGEGAFCFPWEDEYLKEVGQIIKLKKKYRIQSKQTRAARSQRMIALNQRKAFSVANKIEVEG